MAEINLNEIKKGIQITKLLHEKSGFLSSNSDAKRALSENSIAINKNKVDLLRVNMSHVSLSNLSKIILVVIISKHTQR